MQVTPFLLELLRRHKDTKTQRQNKKAIIKNHKDTKTQRQNKKAIIKNNSIILVPWGLCGKLPG